jgi:hypothetical protein
VSERFRDLDDERLGEALTALAGTIAWPADADVTGAVVGSIRDREAHPTLFRPRLTLPSRRRTLVIAIVAVLLVAGAAAAAKLVIDLGVVTIRVIPGRPTGLPSAVASGPTFGHPASLSEAEREAGFRARVPTELGPPDRVWVDRAPDARIVLAWRATDALPAIDDLPWGAVLTGFRGQAIMASKVLFSEGDTLTDTRVGDHRAYWIEGPHELDVVNADGTFSRYQVDANVLIWKTGGVVWRLETLLDERASIALARSMGPQGT